MISGLYTAASGLMAQLTEQDVIANNLANVNTTGYKKDNALYVSFPNIFMNRLYDDQVKIPGGSLDTLSPIGVVGKGVQLRVDGVVPDFTTEGSYTPTNNQLNLAIKGNGMFVIATDKGIRYTRDGNFKVDADQRLVTNDDCPVLGQRGEIIIDGSDVHVDGGGRVFVNGAETDTLRIALFDKADKLRKEGNNLFYLLDGGALPEDSYVENVKIMQGYLESSNVNVVKEMVDMITANRAYEASQRAVQAQNETLNRAVNDVGIVTI